MTHTDAHDASDGASDRTFRLIYRSHSQMTQDDRTAALGDLFTQARSNNKAKDITGALMLSGEWFVQTLEGDELKVRSLFEHIRHDTRHDAVAVIETGYIDDRAFPRWSMAQVSDTGEDDVYLIAHENGIAPATRRGGTPEQDLVLAQMRAAAANERQTAAD